MDIWKFWKRKLKQLYSKNMVKYLVIFISLSLSQWSAASGVEKLTTLTSAFPSWSHDSKKLAFIGYSDGETHIFLTVFEEKKPCAITPPLSNLAGTPVAWSPDDEKIAFVAGKDDDQRIKILVLNTKEIYEIPGKYAFILDICWSPRGDILAVSMGQGKYYNIFLISIETQLLYT